MKKKKSRSNAKNIFIYILLFLWIAVATCAAVYFGLEYFKLKDNNTAAIPDTIPDNEVLVIEPETTGLPEAAMPEQLVIPQGTSMEQIFLVMNSMGYSLEEMLPLVEADSKDAFRAYVEQYVAANPDLVKIQVDTSTENPDTAPEYTKLYPEMYVENRPAAFREDEGTIYLTFDDGPSQRTPEVLDILKKYNIKATFFVCGGTSEDAKVMMKRIVDEGHTIAIHSISHNYKKIYADVESYLADFYETYMCVYEATGVKPELFRFPGGSINNYNRFTYQQIISEMTRRGFVYHDWDVSGEDAVKGADQTSIYSNIMNYISTDGTDRAIVLLHDAADKKDTVAVLPDVIQKLIAYGYKFDKLDNGVKPITFGYKD